MGPAPIRAARSPSGGACGIAGFKPTARRVSREGAFPLSYTLDSIGPLARSAACCAAYDAVLSDQPDAGAGATAGARPALAAAALERLDDLDAHVGKGFAAGAVALARMPVRSSSELKVPAFDRQDEYFRTVASPLRKRRRSIAAGARRIAEYDPRVAKRVALGRDIRRLDHVELGLVCARTIMREIGRRGAFRRIVMPTMPCVAPTIAEIDAAATTRTYVERPHPAQHRAGKLPRRLRADRALPRAGRRPGRTDGDAARRLATGTCSPPAAPWRACCSAVPESGIDPRLARRRFERAARGYARAARLESEVGARMLERLDDMRRVPRRILDAGSGPPQPLFRRRYPNAEVIALDFSLGMLRARKGRWFERNAPRAVCADMGRLPFAAGTVQLAWANMSLHWVADPLAVLRELHRVLAVDGLLLLSTLGPDTLAELGAAAGAARVHRFADMHDIGDQLLAAGFADPVMDAERLTLLYPEEDALLADLRASGQTGSARADGRADSQAAVFGAASPSGCARNGVASSSALPSRWSTATRGRRRRAERATRMPKGRAIVQFQPRR